MILNFIKAFIMKINNNNNNDNNDNNNDIIFNY